MYKRLLSFKDLGKESAFLWGPRQTGKSTFLKQCFPKSVWYDLLKSDEFERFNKRPALLREELLKMHSQDSPVIIDEVQKVPLLLDEVQWLMVNRGISFILCGSSARKLKRGGGNLLGGRAFRHVLFPLVSKEVPKFDLLRAINHGLIPRHYIGNQPMPMIHAYIGDYLKEEIAAEALTRNIPAFGRFLEAAAFSNGSIVNYQNIASECGVSAPTAKEYFQILEDTLLARFLPSFQKKAKRRVIQAPKFYYFDVGIVNFLLKRKTIQPKTELFGYAFEHFIFQELVAHSHYSLQNYPIAYWHTASNLEVDFVLADGETAIEVKGSEQVQTSHLKGLRAFREEFKPRRCVVVSLEKRSRVVDGIEILPWHQFLDELWSI
jgi:uncharacterized protein